MAVLITPVKGFSGPGVAGLMFDAGYAETDDPAVIAYARRHGYTVEDEDEPPHPPPSGDTGPDDTERPARSASKAEWVAYAVAQGADQDDAEQSTKDALIEQYGG